MNTKLRTEKTLNNELLPAPLSANLLISQLQSSYIVTRLNHRSIGIDNRVACRAELVRLDSCIITQASSLPLMTASLYLPLVAWRAEGDG